ncbi:hypothetical protein LTR95_003009 [Oleoguttula sp. CCFEE 5521]
MANHSLNWQSSGSSSQWATQTQPFARRPEDEDNFERNWSWDSGNAQGVVHESRQSWTTTSQASMPQIITTFSAPPLPMTSAMAMPVMQPMLPAMPSMQNFHQQSQQMMNDFHQNALDSHNRMVESMDNNMSMASMSMQSSYSEPQQQIAYHSSSTSLAPAQQQITYHSSSETAPVQQQIAYQSSPPPQGPVQQQPAQIHYTQNVFHQAPPQPQPQQLQVPQQERIAHSDESARFQAIKQTRDNDMRAINEQRTAMKAHMCGIEQQLKEAQKHQDESSQRQIKDLQDQIAESARRQLEEARRHDAEMEELRRNQRSASQPQAPAFDMGTLRKLILETQAKQISAADVQRAVEEAVAQRLVGVVRREDLEAASSSMQKALSKVPQGASEEQVQSAFGKELTKIVERVERHQRREIEAAPLPRQQTWSRPQPEFTVEEIHDDEPLVAPSRVYQPAPMQAQPTQPAYRAQPQPSSAPSQVQYASQPAPVTRTQVPTGTQPGAAAVRVQQVSALPHAVQKPGMRPSQAPAPSTAVARPKKPAHPSADAAAPAVPTAAAPAMAAPQPRPVPYAPTPPAASSGALARVKRSGDSASIRHPLPATAQMQPTFPKAAPIASSGPPSGAMTRVKKHHSPAPTTQHAPTIPMVAQSAPLPTLAANMAPPSGALAKVKKSDARSSTVPAAPVSQAAPMSGTIARVKKPSAPVPVPAPQPAPSTAMLRLGSTPTANVPVGQQPVQQTPSTPAARPARQVIPPPAPAVTPRGAMVRQSKDVAKKPR